jgi:hypothetical protein
MGPSVTLELGMRDESTTLPLLHAHEPTLTLQLSQGASSRTAAGPVAARPWPEGDLDLDLDLDLSTGTVRKGNFVDPMERMVP